MRLTTAVLLLLLGLALVAGLVVVGGRWLQQAPPPPADLGIFEPAAGRMFVGSFDGIWAVDPTRSDRAIKVTSRTGHPVAWSKDGTRLLLEKPDGTLFILHADGSETTVTDRPAGHQTGPGSFRPTGATISPDGSRVVYAGLTKEGQGCDNGALFAVNADGGTPELIWDSPDGIVKGPTFSPDGTRIAFVDGNCDSRNVVWVMNADGTDAHPLLTERTMLYASPDERYGSGLDGGHAYGLAWSPTGDRIALAFELKIYTFATDGSDIQQVGTGGTSGIYWSPDGSQVETTGPWLPATPAPR